MGVQRHVVAITTSAGGSASGTFESPISGCLIGVRLTGFDGSADLTLTARGATLLSKTGIDADEWFYPRVPVHQAADGAAITGGYAEACIVQDKLAYTIANGGNGQTGALELLVRTF